MAQSWMRQDDATPEEAKATWDTLETEFEDKRKSWLMASAETDEIIKTINDKFGPGTMFPASQASQPEMTDQQAIFEWEERNKKAGGGRMKFEKGLLVSDLTPQELVNAQSAARKQGITGKKEGDEFIASETVPEGHMHGPDDYSIDVGAYETGNVGDLASDLTELKTFATGEKQTIKEIVDGIKKKKTRAKMEGSGMDYITETQGDYPYASGGLAGMLGE